MVLFFLFRRDPLTLGSRLIWVWTLKSSSPQGGLFCFAYFPRDSNGAGVNDLPVAGQSRAAARPQAGSRKNNTQQIGVDVPVCCFSVFHETLSAFSSLRRSGDYCKSYTFVGLHVIIQINNCTLCFLLRVIGTKTAPHRKQGGGEHIMAKKVRSTVPCVQHPY